MSIRCSIKGPIAAAEKEFTSREIHATYVDNWQDRTFWDIQEEDLAKVIQWFGEDIKINDREYGLNCGTLLFYS